MPKITQQTVLGIGTGSTVNCFIELLATHKNAFKGVVSSSKVCPDLIANYDIEEFGVKNDVNSVSFYIDGADRRGLHGKKFN